MMKRPHRHFPIVATLALLMTAACQTQNETQAFWPETEPEISSALFSRTGMTVRSIEESLRLYRDILGLTPFYSRPNLDDPRLIDFAGLKAGQTLTLSVLRIETVGPAQINSGYLGLAEINSADGESVVEPATKETGAEAGAMMLMFLVEDMADTYDQILAEGYQIISHPEQRSDGTWSQLLMRGPDGERIWLTQSENRKPFLEKRKRP